MRFLLKLEAAALMVLALYLYQLLGASWAVFGLCFFLPDLGMLGYLANPKVGAATYNLTHHLGIGMGSYLLGVQMRVEWLAIAGLVLLAHAGFDRILGYGLKYPDAFKHTHLDDQAV